MNSSNHLCPWCSADCDGTAEFVDVGVGAVQVTAHQCDTCQSLELGPYERGAYTLEEWRAGWTAPTGWEFDAPKFTANECPDFFTSR
jgi:hypothetical protein